MAGEKLAANESKLPITLKIKRKGFEISIQGTISMISKELDALAEFTDTVSGKLELSEESTVIEQEAAPSEEEIAKTPTADIPVIKASKSTIDNIAALFDTPWGRTQRTFAEIMKALEVNAVPDTSGAISRDLYRLVQKGKLRRIEKEGKWTYLKRPE